MWGVNQVKSEGKNPLIKCACGCGQTFLKYIRYKTSKGTRGWRAREYVGYHGNKKTRFKKGSSGFTGKHTEETKLKLSKMSKGQRRSPKTEFKKGQFAKEKHPFWKGGITPIYDLIRHSKKYIVWKTKVYARDFFTCQICGKTGRGLVAHHIKSFADYPKLRFNITNGITLCKSCHSKIHNFLRRKVKNVG